MKHYISILLCVFASTVAAAEPTPTQREAKRDLERTLKMESYRGSIYAQARLDGIEYRSILRGATNLDGKMLESLLAMKFMGEGGETHCANLLQLMKLWGDDRFSKVLTSQAKKIRNYVIGSIDYAWAEPDWSLYSKTLSTSPYSVTKRTTAEQ